MMKWGQNGWMKATIWFAACSAIATVTYFVAEAFVVRDGRGNLSGMERAILAVNGMLLTVCVIMGIVALAWMIWGGRDGEE